jgi:transcriptional regulator with XRE-family HTH domain
MFDDIQFLESNLMFESAGERLSYCRNLLGISRHDFANKFGEISVPTLSRWELNYTAIPKIKLENLIKFFKSNGIDVNAEWILFNKGHPPINVNLKSLDNLNFDEISYLTLSNLKNNIPNLEVYQINNNFFEPIIFNGDYIGCMEFSNLEILTNKLCYLFQDRMLYAGIFNFTQMNITNFFKQSIKVDDNTKIGAISWIAKRL